MCSRLLFSNEVVIDELPVTHSQQSVGLKMSTAFLHAVNHLGFPHESFTSATLSLQV